MRHFLIITHGKLAAGYMDTIRIILGEVENLTAICVYTDDETIETKMADYFSKIAPEDEVVVFNDLKEGSVNQYFVKLLNQKNLYVITGINLPVIIDFVLASPKEPLSDQKVTEMVESAREQLAYMNTCCLEINNDVEC